MNEFPNATKEMWLARAGNSDRLVNLTADGIRIEPLYQQIAGARADRAVHGPWTVVQRVDHADAGKANTQVLEDLEHGAGGLAIVRSDIYLARALKDVMLHAIHMRLEGGHGLAKAFAEYVGKQPIDPARLDVSFGLSDASLVKDLSVQGFKGPFLEADGRVFHEQGATEAQELACVLAALVAALRESTLAGATLAANQDMFLTLAKFRAIRLLWARVLEASGIPFEPLRLHGETSRRMMAKLDPHTNMLRATVAVFGAGLGGCDTFTVLPFSIAQGVPDAFARRMARNTQLILLEESHLWRVADSASGAGYVESLTQELCEKAWAIFQVIEKAGKLPEFDSKNKSSDPIIGTNSHRLSKESEAAVESIP